MATGRVPTTANSPLTAKGDLFGYSTTQARVPVGNDGETLVADSSASTGLRWQGSTIAGRNFLINGGMDIWQRSTSAAATGGSYASADRWWNYTNSGAATVSRESSIVPAGSQYAMKIASTSAGTSIFHGQVIETANAVRLAGETITVSAKVAASTSVGVSLIVQYNTSVDSTASWTTVTATSGGSATPTSTTYVNLTGVYAMPSTAKTIRIGFQHTSTVASGVDLYIGNVQTEIGSVATPFTRAAGTLAGELAACQRYYEKSFDVGVAPTTNAQQGYITGKVASNTVANQERYGQVFFKVSKRTQPTITIRPYTTVANTGRVSNTTGIDLGANSGGVLSNQENGFFVYNNSGGTITTDNFGVIFHFEASAEL